MNLNKKSPTQIKKFRLAIIGAALAALICISVFSIAFGTIKFSIEELWNFINGNKNDGLIAQIITNVRLPRTLTGILVGMNMSVSGVLLQGILKNPIASPNIIGVNAGAGLAAVIIMTILPEKILLLPMAAFVGALLACFLIYGLAMYSSGNSATLHIVLAGVAVSALLKAITNGLMVIYSDTLEVTYTWLLGSLNGRGWTAVSTIWPYSLVALAVAVFISPKLNLFGLGDEVASSVGLRIGLYRIIIIFTAAVLAGSAVSVAGTIGFIGLIAPHSARLLIGNDHKYLVPLSAILGAALLVLSDTVARTIFQPVELSVGIITSFLGAPFFLFILIKKGKRKAG